MATYHYSNTDVKHTSSANGKGKCRYCKALRFHMGLKSNFGISLMMLHWLGL